MGDKKFIGFDLGAESGRCVVGILKDNKLSLNEVYRFKTHNVQYAKGFHWDVLAIYNELIEGLKYARREFGSDHEGIGIDTWGVDYTLVDIEGRIIGYPYHYRDDRTDNMMDHAFSVVPKEEIYNKAGIQFAQYNTLFQILSETKRKTNLLSFADKMLLTPDFLNFTLCGKQKAEYSIASTTNMADPYKRDWSWELIDKFSLPRNIFPEMVEPGTKLGTLLPSVAQETGLNPNIPVIAVGGHDTASAVASVPVSGDNIWAFLCSGTWSLMGIELSEPLISPIALQYNFTNEGGVQKTIRFLKNIIGLWPVQECRRYWIEKGTNYSYANLASMAKDYGNAGAWIDLNDIRFLKAGQMPEKIISFLRETGQKSDSDPAFIIRVILESLAFTYRNTLKEIEITTGKKINKLHAVGGGIQNELLTQLTADAIGRTVIAGPIEGTTAGNIGMQAIASGVVPDLKTWRSIVGDSFGLKTYEPVNALYFNKNEDNYKKILK